MKGKFASVYDIPAGGLSLTAIPWLFLVAGVLCFAAGAVVLLTKGSVGLVVTLALGAALVVGPLVLGAPGKAAGGEDVKEFASRGLTQRAATAASEASVALDGLLRDADERGLAAQRQSFPAAAELISDWNVIGPRLARLSRAVSDSVGDFRSAKQLPMSSPVWLMLGAGLALALTAGVALVRSR